MYIESSDIVVSVLIVLGVVIAMFVAWNLTLRGGKEVELHTPASLDEVSKARIEDTEFRASLISEEIEERVKQILKESDPALADDLDFGTASDGSLRIWYKDRAYSSVDEIPDSLIREAVGKAVEEFNQ